MRKRLAVWTLIPLMMSTLVACNDRLILTPLVTEFNFDTLNDVTYQFPDNIGAFSHLEGLNIADGDYELTDGILSIKKDFLVSLNPGKHSVKLFTTLGEADLDFTVLDLHNANRIINGGFETGDLFGWMSQTIFKGETQLQGFIDSGVALNDASLVYTVAYNGDGDYVYGVDSSVTQTLWEEHMGLMSSRAFTLGGSGFIAFKLGAGKNSDLSYLAVRNAVTGEEVGRYGNSHFNATGVTNEEALFAENLVEYKADLSPHLGEELQIDIVDYGARTWDFITLDSIETYNETEPTTGTLAINVKPTFEQAYVPNQLANGDFSDGLTSWTVSDQRGWYSDLGVYDTFQVPAGMLRSDATGDTARGLLRSSLFRVDGSGVISLQLGAAQGTHFDKDTYVSIRQAVTNTEVFRFANTRHNGNTMITYYLDLSDYLGKSLYFEIIDNATGSYDTIFVDNIVTYYATAPVYDFGDTAADLNSRKA